MRGRNGTPGQLHPTPSIHSSTRVSLSLSLLKQLRAVMSAAYHPQSGQHHHRYLHCWQRIRIAGLCHRQPNGRNSDIPEFSQCLHSGGLDQRVLASRTCSTAVPSSQTLLELLRSGTGVVAGTRLKVASKVTAGTLDFSGLRHWSSTPSEQSFSKGGHFVVSPGATLDLSNGSVATGSPRYSGRYYSRRRRHNPTGWQLVG